jgi:hypothetical protein
MIIRCCFDQSVTKNQMSDQNTKEYAWEKDNHDTRIHPSKHQHSAWGDLLARSQADFFEIDFFLFSPGCHQANRPCVVRGQVGRTW